MSGFFLVLVAFGMSIGVFAMASIRRVARAMLVKFSRFLEIMAFAGNAEQADGHEKQ